MFRSSLTRNLFVTSRAPVVAFRRCVHADASIPKAILSRKRYSYLTHCAAGLAGGLSVLAGAYTWYYFSDARKVILASKQARQYLRDKKEATSRHPRAVLSHLRNAGRSCTTTLPWARPILDAQFDRADEIIEEHEKEAISITESTYDEIEDTMKESRRLSDLQASLQVFFILHNRLKTLAALQRRPDEESDVSPEAQEGIRKSIEELRGLMRTKRRLEDIKAQAKGFLSEGSPTRDSFNKTRTTVQEKIASIRRDPKSPSADTSTEDKDT